MYERLTEPARHVLVLAQEEARSLESSFIGTEHLLIGLILDGSGSAAKALHQLGVSVPDVRKQISLRQPGPGSGMTGSPAFTARAKKVLELALREALTLGHTYIGPEHILLGIVRDGEGVAAEIMVETGIPLVKVRQELVKELSGYDSHRPNGGGNDVPEAIGPRCSQCSSELDTVMRHRRMTVAPSSLNSPMEVDVIYCGLCGSVFGVARVDSPD